MSYKKSVVMMSNTGKNFNLVGEPVKTESYYGYSDGFQTVQVIYNNFTGGFGIQGTLSLTPSESDWFWVRLDPTDREKKFIEYPKDPLNPTASPSTNVPNVGDTGSDAFTFQGNFTFLRAVMTRDYITPTPVADINNDFLMGSIDRVLINL